MIALVLGFALHQTVVPKPHAFLGDKCDPRQPQVMSLMFNKDNKIVAFARDGEMRWYDNPKQKPVRARKMAEIPVRDFSAQEKAENDKLIEMHRSMWGDIPYNFFVGRLFLPLEGAKQFYITDAKEKFYLYDMETGDLVKKIRLTYKTAVKGTAVRVFVEHTGKRAMLWYGSADTALCFDLETGKELSRFPIRYGLDTIELSPNGERVYASIDNKFMTYDPVTGKAVGKPVVLPEVSYAAVLVSPDSKRVAYGGYNKNGEAMLNAIIDVETSKITKIDQRLVKFWPNTWTPDGKYLALNEDGYMHFVDTTTGVHEFSYTTGFPDLWNRSGFPRFSLDSKKMAFVPELGVDIQTSYFIVVDMTQPRNRKLLKIGP